MWYLAYQEGTKSQEIAAQRVRDLEKEMARRQDDLRQLENTPVPMHQLAALHAAQEQIQTRLQQDGRIRDAYNSVLDSARARVDVCLENLSALTEAAKGLNTAEIRSLK